MPNDIELAALICSITTKDESKLLKQHLLNDFWQYLSIGESLWNLIFSTHFEIPNGTWKILNVFVSCVLSWIWKVFLIEIRLMCAKIYFNPIKVNIKPTLWSCRLTLELELSFILFSSVAINFKYFWRSIINCASGS